MSGFCCREEGQDEWGQRRRRERYTFDHDSLQQLLGRQSCGSTPYFSRCWVSSNATSLLQKHYLTSSSHETTSSALTWSSYLLSRHPDIQTRLRTEIHTSIPDPSVLSNPGYDISTLIESMPYLNAVCNEVLRLYPTIPVSGRHTTRPTTVAGHFIPTGTTLFVVPWAINRNPAFWGADADSFVPERWIDASSGRATMNGGAESNYAFLTFLHGPRSCIGEKFARSELRCLVAALVGSFEMQMADPDEVVIVGGTVTSKPMNGMRLRLKPVQWGE